MDTRISLFIFTCNFVALLHGLEYDKLLAKGYGNIQGDVQGEATVTRGQIPAWINGTFIRHSCGVFGDMPDDLGVTFTWVDDLFDCINMGTAFHIKDGSVSYTSRYWPSASNSVFSKLGRNMTKSRVFWETVLADYDADAVKRVAPLVDEAVDSGMELAFPGTSWWNVFGHVGAWSESLTGHWINIDKVEDLGLFPFKDNFPNLPPGSIQNDQPAHELYDDDGTLWACSWFYVPQGHNKYLPKLVVYKVGKDMRRETISTYTPGRVIETSECRAGEPYRDLHSRQGYLHSFSMTHNYVIIPVSSWLLDPCALFSNSSKIENKPFFIYDYNWYSNVTSYFLVIRKSDGKLLNRIETAPTFVTHQLNAYEWNGTVVMDMLTYNDASLYVNATKLKNLLTNNHEFFEGRVERFELRVSDWSLRTRRFLRHKNPDPIEMPNINPRFSKRPYKYTYLLHNGWMKGGGIIKLNVETKEEIVYELEEGVYPQEPVFLPAPNSLGEDDGVVLFQTVNTKREKASMVLLDGRTMKLVAEVVAPGNALFGIHNKFFSNADLKPIV